MQFGKWCASLANRIPTAVAKALQLKVGDEIEVHVGEGRRVRLARKPGRDELLARLRADFVFDRDEANER